MTSYVLDNAAPEARARFAELQAMYDPVTIDALNRLRVTPGWRCWEVGAGSGSIAAWLAFRMGHEGTVYATDVDTRWVSGTAREVTTVLTHDVVKDPAPAVGLDLIHARLVASHLPEWNRVLPRLVNALTPGGWLVVEELDPMHRYQPDQPPVTLINRVGDAFTRVLASRGGNPHLGRSLFAQFTTAGLVNVSARGIVHTDRGGPACRLMRVNVTQMVAELRHHISDTDLDRYVEQMSHPDTVITMPVFWTVQGQVPRCP